MLVGWFVRCEQALTRPVFSASYMGTVPSVPCAVDVDRSGCQESVSGHTAVIRVARLPYGAVSG